jgi:hypothetical protein
MSSLVFSPLAAQGDATASASRSTLIVFAAVLLLLALGASRQMLQPLHELLRALAAALLLVLLIASALALVIGALILSL